MNAEAFIDTNVFLYSISDRPEEQVKTERARQLLLNENWGWSVQVAGEFYHVATSVRRQFRLSHSEAIEYVRTWLSFPTASLQPSTVLNALQMRERFQVSYWDATIIAAAHELGCSTIYSEDLNDGQDYGGVKVVNPFLASL
jgi:predicted nucleic acid-binding protein